MPGTLSYENTASIHKWIFGSRDVASSVTFLSILPPLSLASLGMRRVNLFWLTVPGDEGAQATEVVCPTMVEEHCQG